MNQEEIIEMARQVGLWPAVTDTFPKELEAFAKLVAQHEREACAKLLEEAVEVAKDTDPQGFVWRAVKESAEAIRARGQA